LRLLEAIAVLGVLLYSGIYALNDLRILQDEAWVRRLTLRMVDIDGMGLKPHVGKVFPATDVARAHEYLQTKQATGKILLAW
jgi:NADPH:quinone reductase-like Zn-dependent oxidoreductase